MSSTTNSTGLFRPAAGPERPAVQDQGELNSLSEFRSEADEARPADIPSLVPHAPLPAAVPIPSRAVVATALDLQAVAPNRRSPVSPLRLAIPMAAVLGLGAPIYYVYAEPVRRSPTLPLVRSAFEPFTTRYLPAFEPVLVDVTTIPLARTPRNRTVRTTRIAGAAVPDAGPGAQAVGLLYVNARPWADVWVDGLAAGTTPLANLRVPVGTHEVVWKHPHLGERRQRVTVTRDAPTRIGMNLQTP